MDHVEIKEPASTQSILQLSQCSPAPKTEQCASPSKIPTSNGALALAEIRRLQLLPEGLYTESDFDAMLRWSVQQRVDFWDVYVVTKRIRLAQYAALLEILERYGSQI
jgi:hypothetical protein